MRWPGAPSLALGSLLALSLGWKVWADRPDYRPDQPYSSEVTRTALAQLGMSVAVRPHPLGDAWFGRRGDCAMMAAELDPTGVNAAMMMGLARPYPNRRFIYRGRAYTHQPGTIPTLDLLVTRQLHRAGLDPPRRPVWMIAARGKCPDPTSLRLPRSLPV